MKNTVVVSLLGVVCFAGCGSGPGNSGPAGCGKVEPCGGSVVGTWDLIGGCINQSALASQVGSSSCPGGTVSTSGVSASGAITFNADMTYTTTSVKESFTMTETLPASCLGGLTCAALTTELEALVSTTSGIESVSCVGTSSCACSFVASLTSMGESGTYVASGNTLTTTNAATGSTSTGSYCVQGTQLHDVSVDTTMNTGPMGQATIDSDVMAMRR